VSVARGSIVWVDLGPGHGSEQRKRRPAVILSNDTANKTAEALGRGVITVIPLTSSERRPYAFQVAIPQRMSNLPYDSVAQIEQVRSIDISRLSDTTKRLPDVLMAEISHALRVHLNLW
jgi:mRNA interferase MazF